MRRRSVNSIARFRLVLAAATVVTLAVAPSNAQAYTQLVAFGDSLTDSGNICPIPFNCPSPPYLAGRFSNGPTWVELLAADLGLAAAPSGSSGTNHAVGGATTSNILGQVTAYNSAHGGAIDPAALYVLNGGGNDIILGGDPASSANNIGFAVLALINAGAQDILVMNLGDVGATPQEPAGQRIPTQAFNSVLEANLASLDVFANIIRFDAFASLDAVIASPGANGFTDVTTACWDGVTLCSDPDGHLWWDRLHPGSVGHELLAASALASVPEPAIGCLLAIGLGAIASRRAPIR